MKYKVVQKSASVEAIDSGVAFALNVTLSNEYRWSDYMRDLYASMVKAAPDTGMVAVRRELLSKMWRTIEATDSFNSFTAEEESEMIEALSAGV